MNLENPYGKCSGCGKFLSSEDICRLCWRCFADGKESKEEPIFDKPTLDGETNLREVQDRAHRLKTIFEGRDNV